MCWTLHGCLDINLAKEPFSQNGAFFLLPGLRLRRYLGLLGSVLQRKRYLLHKVTLMTDCWWRFVPFPVVLAGGCLGLRLQGDAWDSRGTLYASVYPPGKSQGTHFEQDSAEVCFSPALRAKGCLSSILWVCLCRRESVFGKSASTVNNKLRLELWETEGLGIPL